MTKKTLYGELKQDDRQKYLAANVFLFVGLLALLLNLIFASPGEATISLDDDMSDWTGATILHDPSGDSGDCEHSANTDVLQFAVFHDTNYLYFYWKIAGQIYWSQSSFWAGIDADNNASTGYSEVGIEYQAEYADYYGPSTARLALPEGDPWSWATIYSFQPNDYYDGAGGGSILQLRVPRDQMELNDVIKIYMGANPDYSLDPCTDTATQAITYILGGENPPVVTNPAANPDKIPNDGSTGTLLTVTVTDPDGDLVLVVIDLSPLGGNPSQVMYDDGTNGDVYPGDGIYSVRTTAFFSTPIAFKALQVTATDENGNAGSNVISLFVTSTIADTVQPQSTNSHSVVNSIAGQTLNITYFLMDVPVFYHLLETGVSEVTLTVKKPNGEIYATETMSSTEKALSIADAEAGTWTYEVSNGGSVPLYVRVINQAEPASYRIETVTGGIGIVSGTVTDADTLGKLTGVLVTTDTGGVALSVDGYYVMIVTAGVFTVTASSFGYSAESAANVTVNAGATASVDFSLASVPINELKLVGITTDLTGAPQTGTPVKVTANATGPNTIYYRFLYKAGYGTPAYNIPGGFIVAQDWSTDNSADITFPSADNYIVIVQATEGSSGTWVFGDTQGGMNIYVGNPSELQLKSITTSSVAGIPTVGQPVTISANSTNSGVPYYRFLYKAGYGTPAYNIPGGFVIAQDWSTDSTADITFPSADNYIVIAHATEDSSGAWAFGDPQGGLNIVVESP